MQALHSRLKRREPLAAGFGHEQYFVVVADFSLPAVDGLDLRNNAHARGQPLANQLGGNLSPLFKIARRDENNEKPIVHI